MISSYVYRVIHLVRYIVGRVDLDLRSFSHFRYDPTRDGDSDSDSDDTNSDSTDSGEGEGDHVRGHPFITFAKFSGFWTPPPLFAFWAESWD